MNSVILFRIFILLLADGHWSTWSPWSNCPNDCVILQPNSTMSQLSNHSKILEYNNKLICSTQCRQSFGQRTRWCNAPEPHGGGRKCHGENTEHLSCYDICLGKKFFYMTTHLLMILT